MTDKADVTDKADLTDKVDVTDKADLATSAEDEPSVQVRAVEENQLDVELTYSDGHVVVYEVRRRPLHRPASLDWVSP